MLTGLLVAVPTWLMAVIVCTVAVVLTTVAQAAMHALWHMDSRHRLNEVAGFLIAVVGVVYAVLLASIAVLALERHQRADLAVDTEAGQLSDMFDTADGLETATTERLHALLSDYGDTVVSVEWPNMTKGLPPESGWQDQGWTQTDALNDLLTRYQPTTETQKIVLQLALRQLDELSDARRTRIFTTGSGIAPLVWWVLIAGATITVGLALVFGLPSWRGHLLLANMLALSIALVFVLIIAMDRPFVGGSGVSPESFQRVIAGIAGVDEP
jgi:hypothetical protein